MSNDDPQMAYCVKCRSQQVVHNPVESVMKNGANAVKGTCQVCGTKVLKFLKRSA